MYTYIFTQRSTDRANMGGEKFEKFLESFYGSPNYDTVLLLYSIKRDMVYKERGYFMNLVRNFRGKFKF
jgi:hypothetical protein